MAWGHPQTSSPEVGSLDIAVRKLLVTLDRAVSLRVWGCWEGSSYSSKWRYE